MVPFVVASAANFRSAFPLALHRARRAFRTHESPAPQAFGLTVPPTLLAAPCGDQLSDDVRYWHKADIPSCTTQVRFRVQRTCCEQFEMSPLA